jgi:peptidoglycan/xylan/chitin deacetylase (PgdA/CDA1 family)
MRVCLTVDLVPDPLQARNAYRGVVEGTPALLTMLAEERVPSTFFATADVARRFGNIVRQIVDWGHELGCLGDPHHHFHQLPEVDARSEIHVAIALLRRYYRVISFRAPDFRFPERYLPLLEEEDFLIDSSLAKHRAGYWVGPHRPSRLLRVPVSTSSVAWRLPRILRSPLLRSLGNPVVLVARPWEFVDLHQAEGSFKNRFRTGPPALDLLRDTIRWFQRRGAVFMRLEDLLPQDDITIEVLDEAATTRSVA